MFPARVALVVLLGCSHASPPPAVEPVAIVAARRGVATAPKDPEARDALGEALLLHGSLDRAERAFAEALELAPAFATAYHGVAMVRLHRGDEPGALAALNAGLALTPAVDPTYARTRLLEAIAWVHVLAGRERQAREAIAASVVAQGLEPPIAERVTHLGQARLSLHLRRWSEALAEIQAAVAPGAPDFVMWGGAVVEIHARIGAGDVAAAETALGALAGAGEHPGVIDAKAAIAIANGELEVAGTLVATLEPIDPYAAEDANLALARALRRAGRDADAKARFAAIAARYLRSAPSVHARKSAAGER